MLVFDKTSWIFDSLYSLVENFPLERYCRQASVCVAQSPNDTSIVMS
uniref:Uncharacterized protein n=1 Tax=Ascaris lumbricoides TaxID=6252 RepID=A0A0M3ITA1_ASCLU